MTIAPNAPDRDGFRETQLRDLGIDTPVVHDGRGNVTVTIPLRTLDQMLEGTLFEADHSECLHEDDITVAEEVGHTKGWAAALAAIEKFAAEKKAAS